MEDAFATRRAMLLLVLGGLGLVSRFVQECFLAKRLTSQVAGATTAEPASTWVPYYNYSIIYPPKPYSNYDKAHIYVHSRSTMRWWSLRLGL